MQKPPKGLRVLGSTTLALEAVVVLLGMLVAMGLGSVSGGNTTLALIVGLTMAVLLLLLAGMTNRPWVIPAGWVMQVLVIACGFVVPAMFIVGVVFALLWYASIALARKVARIQAGEPQ